MAFRKKTKKEEIKVIEPEIIETSEDKTEEPIIESKEEEIVEEVKKEVKIKKGSKVIVSGRLFGSSKLECPMNSIKNYETKIIEIENGNYLIDLGWISPNSIKD